MTNLSEKSKFSVLPWIEKYRPIVLDDIISHKTVIEVLRKTIKDNKLQHMLFYGVSGVGKTSSILACARELYGNKMDLMTLNINASEERGIEVVRNRIQQFVNAKIIHSENNRSMFKLVILDEADAMTADAQAMLRKVIEKYSYCTRFCLICNYIKKITPALQSRCACYRFPPLKTEDIRKKIIEIAQKENINITDGGINTIIKRSKGDMRKVLNILQSTSMSYDNITEEIINKCIGYPNTSEIKKIIDSLLEDTFADSYKIISEIKTKNSYSLQDIISEISNDIITEIKKDNSKYTDKRIIAILRKLGQIEYNLTTCVMETIQLSALIGIFKYTVPETSRSQLETNITVKCEPINRSTSKQSKNKNIKNNQKN